MISPSRRPVPHNTQHSQQTRIHAPDGIRTHNFSRRAAADLRLRPGGHWDRLYALIVEIKKLIENVDPKPRSEHLETPCTVARIISKWILQSKMPLLSTTSPTWMPPGNNTSLKTSIHHRAASHLRHASHRCHNESG